MKIKLEAKTLKDFLSTSTLNGKIESLLINFTNNGIEINAVMENNVGATLSILDKIVCKTISGDDIKIGVKDTKLLINILGTFNGVVELEITENSLVVKDENKVANLVNMKPEFVETNLPKEHKDKLVDMFDGGIKMSSNIFIKAVKNSGIIGSDSFEIRNKNNSFVIITGENKFNKIEESINLDYKDFETKFSDILKDAVSVLTDEITLSVAGDYKPIMFTIKNENFLSKIVVSPLDKVEE